MKRLRRAEAPSESRPDGRQVTTLFATAFERPLDSIRFLLVDLPDGRFPGHYHAASHELILFPAGGAITVNGETLAMAPWDGVLLEPGDVHSYIGEGAGPVIQLAVQMPPLDDRVTVE